MPARETNSSTLMAIQPLRQMRCHLASCHRHCLAEKHIREEGTRRTCCAAIFGYT